MSSSHSFSSGGSSSGGHSSGGGRNNSWKPHLVPVPGAVGITLKHLLKRHPLPVSAHLQTPAAPPGLDLSQPLLLYKQYTSTKVVARSLKPASDGSLHPVGPTLVIPDSYSGWFAKLTSDGQTAPYYNTIEQVAANQLSFFLCRYDVPAYRKVEETDASGEVRVSYSKTTVGSGHVLKLMGVFEDLNARKNQKLRHNVFNSSKYAQCLNYRNEVLFLPFSAAGRFYSTAHKSSRSQEHVYLMAHILKNHKLPITVRLVCGYMPRVPCSFTGVLRLEKSQKESVVLACTMTGELKATMLEIDVASNFQLAPVTDPLMPKTPVFLKTVSYCQDEADAWRRQIKVTHHVTEKRSRSLTRSLSEKFFEPLKSSSNHSLNIALFEEEKKKKKKGKKEDGGAATRETRKLSKQNTYILQHSQKTSESPETTRVQTSSSSHQPARLCRSIENLEYSRVLDDISPIPEDVSEEEDHYTQICDYALPPGTSENKREAFRRHMSKENIRSPSSGGKATKGSKETGKRPLSTDSNPRKSQSEGGKNSLTRDIKKKTTTEEVGMERVRIEVRAESLLEINELESLKEFEVDEAPFIDYRHCSLPPRRTEKTSVFSDENRITLTIENEPQISSTISDSSASNFTLLKTDVGGYYVRLPGFEIPKEEIGVTVNGDDINGYDSLC